jgi:hypothetical protein
MIRARSDEHASADTAAMTVVDGALIAARVGPVRPTHPIITGDGECDCVDGENCTRAGRHLLPGRPWTRNPMAIELLFGKRPCGIVLRTHDATHAIRSPATLLTTAIKHLDEPAPLLLYGGAAILFFTAPSRPAAAAALVARRLPPHARFGYIGAPTHAFFPVPPTHPIRPSTWAPQPSADATLPNFTTIWTAILRSLDRAHDGP